MKRLFDLSDEILALEAQLDDEELDDDRRQQLIDAWLEAQGDAEQKLDNYAAWIESLETSAEQRTYQAERMLRLAQADKHRAKRGKERLQLYFERHGLKKFKTPRFTIGHQANGGKAPLIVPPTWEEDPTLAPENFRKVSYSLDKEAIRAALEAVFDGEAERERAEWLMDAGCKIGERGSSIRIR